MSKRTKSVSVSIPKSKEDCAQLIADMAKIQAKMNREQQVLSEAVAKQAEYTEGKIAPLRSEHEALSQRVQSYCEAHKDALTMLGHHQKSFDFTTGRVSWRLGSEFVEIDAGKDKELLAEIRKKKLPGIISTKVTVAKAALKKALKAGKVLEFARIKRHPENFIITPHDVSADIEAEPTSNAA